MLESKTQACLREALRCVPRLADQWERTNDLIEHFGNKYAEFMDTAMDTIEELRSKLEDK